jgi:GT2 family glycosyltransferase
MLVRWMMVLPLLCPSVSIVIPNWNGVDLLRANLPAVHAAAEHYAGKVEILVVDDASTDDSMDFVRCMAPFAKVVGCPRNGGFAVAVQTGMEAASYEIVALLNTDIHPKLDFLAPLAQHFERSDVFAVSCLGLRDDGLTHGEGAKLPRFKRGLLKFIPAFPSEPMPSFYAVGGHCALSRAKFLELGGFDSLFEPFYWEDVDLCYRAWKRGWKTIFEPSSRVIHRHRQGAIARSFRHARVATTNHRNRLLFMWKNIGVVKLLAYHLPMMSLRMLLGFLWLDFRFYAAFGRALTRLPATIRSRREARRSSVMTDREIFGLLGSTGGK